MRGLGLIVAALSGASCLAAPLMASAQDIQSSYLGSEIPFDYNRGRNVGVVERDRPEYQALGVSAGAFTLFPRVETGVGYLDNVFGTRTNTTGDGYFILDPSVTARSDWSRHSLVLSTGAQLREFFSQGTENEEGAYAQADGRLDVNSDNAIFAGAVIRKSYEERSAGGYPVGAAAPVEFVQSGGYLRASHEGGRIKLVGSTDVNHFSFSDVPAIGGGFISQSNRDQTLVRVSSRAEYAITPDSAGYGQATYTRIDYSNDLAPGVSNRQSNEYKVIGGSTFDLTALIRGQVGLGYVSREYDSALYRNISGLSADAVLEYFPTQLTTLTLSGRRIIQDAQFVGSGGYFNNGVNLRVDHELLYNLLLNAQVDYERDDFDHFDRTDEIKSYGVGARYLLSREVGLGAGLSYTQRDSSGAFAGIVFDETRFTLTLVLQR